MNCSAFRFFVAKGLRDFQAAGVVGNLLQESGLNPRAVGDAGISFGIAQWNGQRWQALQAFARHRDVWSLETQLEFVWHELASRGQLTGLQATQTLEDATVFFQDRFEVCGACNTPARIAFARQALMCSTAVRPPAAPSGGSLAFVGAAIVTATAGFAAWQMRKTFP